MKSYQELILFNEIKNLNLKKLKAQIIQQLELSKILILNMEWLSDTQIMVRGQYGKKWISHKGNLFVSFFYELKILNFISTLTKINCLLVKKLLKIIIKKNYI